MIGAGGHRVGGKVKRQKRITQKIEVQINMLRISPFISICFAKYLSSPIAIRYLNRHLKA